MTIKERLYDVISRQLNSEVKDLTDDTNLHDDLCADSLDIVELTMAVEEEFNITITNEEAAEWKTVGDILEICYCRLGRAKE